MTILQFPRLSAIAAGLLLLTCGAVRAEAINGAIYTSTIDHSQINANLYPTKESVYLNGGPSNSGCNGGKLDDGTYHFQVTDPSGATLLSNGSSIWDRTFQVINGVIAVNLGDQTKHPNGGTSPCGSLAIRLFPYDDTPNNGGEYKVWITRTSDFARACGVDAYNAPVDCGKAGFVPGNIKTDNFKVGTSLPPQPLTGDLIAYKFYDANANGLFDVGEPHLTGWQMTLTSASQVVDSTHYTDGVNGALFNDLQPAGDYLVTEGMPVETNWVHSATIYPGKPDTTASNPAGPLTVTAGETTQVWFGNYCTIPSNGRTLGFWSNKNGQAMIDANDLAALRALHLRNANGSDFDPATAAKLRTWLLEGNAVNMAYMLSVQLAAMKLNVLNGFVNGGGYYVPAGATINEIMLEAESLLAQDGYTPAGDEPMRTRQEIVKNWIDALNNGAGLLSPTPCAYTFN